ncbi:Glycoside-hydrolase family GH114 TIM-barrel domain-containing protein OS=Streptomyces albaduncus OX=68172 GN=FHS32_003323 PE=4 SV=1 [Streptomyces griseoloalbus]
MAVGLKNDLDQIRGLVGDFDFAVNEQCAQYGECDRTHPVRRRRQGRLPRRGVQLPAARFCADSRRLGLSMLKKYELGAWHRAC